MTHEGRTRRRWRLVNSGPGASGGRAARPFVELRGAARFSAGLRFAENSETKNEHHGLPTSKGSAMVLESGAPFSAPAHPPRENGGLANAKFLMGRTLLRGPGQLKTLLAFCEVQRVSSCGPHTATTRCLPRSERALSRATGYCLWNVSSVQVAVVLPENPQAPVYWEPPGGPAPGREPREGCPTKRLFPIGKSAAAQRTGQRRVVRHQGASLGVFWQVCRLPRVAKGCLWVASTPPHPPTPPSPYEIRPPRRPMWSYTGFPPPLQVVVPRIRSHEAVSRSALLQVPNSVYPSTNRYPVATGLPR